MAEAAADAAEEARSSAEQQVQSLSHDLRQAAARESALTDRVCTLEGQLKDARRMAGKFELALGDLRKRMEALRSQHVDLGEALDASGLRALLADGDNRKVFERLYHDALLRIANAHTWEMNCFGQAHPVCEEVWKILQGTSDEQDEVSENRLQATPRRPQSASCRSPSPVSTVVIPAVQSWGEDPQSNRVSHGHEVFPERSSNWRAPRVASPDLNGIDRSTPELEEELGVTGQSALPLHELDAPPQSESRRGQSSAPGMDFAAYCEGLSKQEAAASGRVEAGAGKPSRPVPQKHLGNLVSRDVRTKSPLPTNDKHAADPAHGAAASLAFYRWTRGEVKGGTGRRLSDELFDAVRRESNGDVQPTRVPMPRRPASGHASRRPETGLPTVRRPQSASCVAQPRRGPARS